MTTKVADLFSREQLLALTARSDRAGWWAVGSTWAGIALTFAMLAAWPNPLTFVLAVVLLGGRQLALAILMHEAAHASLFRTRALNDVLTDWLCARVMWNDVRRYRTHHLRHHAHTGTELDPDMSLVTPFPTSRAALARKLARDLLGVTGLKRVVGLLLIDFGVLEYTVASDPKRRPRDGRGALDYAREGVRNLWGPVLANTVLLGALAATGHAWLFWAWIVAYLTTFSLFIRIRSIAEHACTERSADMLRNTRTTRAGPLARLTVAPIRVNFHVEHHLLPAVPYFQLAPMHAVLRARGVVPTPPSYIDVLALASSAP